MFENVYDIIEKNKMFKGGDIVGVACGGGSDSMALLHFLNSNKEKFDIDVIAIYVNHNTKPTDIRDQEFVAKYCKENGIRFYKFRIEALAIARKKGLSIEDASQEGRNGVFESLKQRQIIDKLAIAHQNSDQAETVLLNILCGTGLSGAAGMSFVENGFYVRPFLTTKKSDILQYVYENQIPCVEDETNNQNIFSRDLLRNKILPELRLVWPNVDQALVDFGKTCKEDDGYINSMVNMGGVIIQENIAKIPLTYFVYPQPIASRVIQKTFKALNVGNNIERKYLALISSLAKNGVNGARVDLSPYNCRVFKEYDYLTIVKAKPKMVIDTEWPFKLGATQISDFGKIKIKKSKDKQKVLGMLLADLDKIPQGAVWRMRKEGDVIVNFGGGTKTLKAYMIDKKIPQRIRDITPVLALDNEVFMVAGVDVSDKLKITEQTKNAILIQYINQN